MEEVSELAEKALIGEFLDLPKRYPSVVQKHTKKVAEKFKNK